MENQKTTPVIQQTTPATPVVQQSTALDAVISDSGLQLSESEAIKQSYIPYFDQMAEVKEQASKINFEQPTDIDEKIARELRLKLVKIRKGSEDVKKDRKKIHSLKANLEQSAWNLIKDTCLLEENKFQAVEKRGEIAEANRKETLRLAREAAVEKYGADTEYIALGEMSEEVYIAYFNGVKAVYEQRVAAELRVEEDRVAREQAAENERNRMKAENERLQKETAAKDAQLAKERAEAAQVQAVKDAQLAKERAEAVAKEEALAAAVEAKRLEEHKKSEDARKETERKFQLEVNAKNELLAQEKAKAEAQNKVNEELQAKAEAVKAAKAKEEADKQEAIQVAMQAELSKGDTEKFRTILNDLSVLKTKYQFESDRYKAKHFELNGLIDKIIARCGDGNQQPAKTLMG